MVATFKNKRFGWWRAYNDLTRHPKWRMVAKLAGVPVSEVVAVVTDLLSAANKGTPRGNVEDFKILESAAALDIEADNVARIYAALESAEVGWIDQGFISDWFDRQPDTEDPTAADRQRRRRIRLRELEKAVHLSAVSRVTHRDITEITLDKTRQTTSSEYGTARARQDQRPQRLISGKNGEKPSTDEAARAWLLGAGDQTYGLACRTVAERCGLRIALSADAAIRRWLEDMAGDALALSTAIWNADNEAINAEAFENLIRAAIAQHRQEAQGPVLPLGPALLRGGGSG